MASAFVLISAANEEAARREILPGLVTWGYDAVVHVSDGMECVPESEIQALLESCDIVVVKYDDVVTDEHPVLVLARSLDKAVLPFEGGMTFGVLDLQDTARPSTLRKNPFPRHMWKGLEFLTGRREHRRRSRRHVSRVAGEVLESRILLSSIMGEIVPGASAVQFSAYCPSTVLPSAAFVLQVFAHTAQQSDEVTRIANERGPVSRAGWKSAVTVPHDAEITIAVTFPKLSVEPQHQSIEWTGEVASADFIVNVPDGAGGKLIGTATVIVSGVVKSVFAIEVNVGASPSTEVATVQKKVIRSVFASYSSVDREEVLRFKQHVEAVGIDVFVDVTILRSGENWKERLTSEITSRDLFCLFWSKTASRSNWVRREWKLALDTLGCEFIQPVPLVDPRDVRPPRRLQQCSHFESIYRIAADYERFWRESKAKGE